MMSEPIATWKGEFGSVNAVSCIEVQRIQAVQSENVSSHFIAISIVQDNHFFDGAPATSVGINGPDCLYGLNPELLVQTQNKRRI